MDEDRGEGKRFSDLEATRAQGSNKFRLLRFRLLPFSEKRMRGESETKELFLDRTFHPKTSVKRGTSTSLALTMSV